MLDDNPFGDLVERAENLVMRLRDVQSCKITTDETGSIAEVHVVASSDKQPKLIARDVETCLKAELNLAIDYRKIGVVLIEPRDDMGSGVGREEPMAGYDGNARDPDLIIDERLVEAPRHGDGDGHDPLEEERPAELEFLEDEMRVRFTGLALDLGDSDVNVEVKLGKGDLEVVGCKREIRTSDPVYEAIAGATLHGLMELLDEKFRMCLSDIKEVEISGNRALIAVVNCVEGRSVRSFSGCVFIGRDPNEAAVLAVLDAVNRPFGRWKARKEIHYTIR